MVVAGSSYSNDEGEEQIAIEEESEEGERSVQKKKKDEKEEKDEELKQKLIKDSDEDGKKEKKAHVFPISESTILFQGMLIIASVYYAMLITNWGNPTIQSQQSNFY